MKKTKKKTTKNKSINERLENHQLESLCLADFTWRLLWRSFNCLRWQRLSDENYHSNEKKIPVDWIRHMSKPYTHVPTERFVNPPTTRSIFTSHSVYTTVARVTTKWRFKSVDKVRPTVFYKNSFCVFATCGKITKADLPVNFIVFHCRMSTIQPAWEICTTSECWHMHRWHFCSCSSHKTIPSLGE